jgi:hypothetical protein
LRRQSSSFRSGYLDLRAWRSCDGDVSIAYEPLSGSLKGENLGTVAFRVLSSTPLFDHSTGALTQVEVEVLDAGTVCEQELQPLPGRARAGLHLRALRHGKACQRLEG